MMRKCVFAVLFMLIALVAGAQNYKLQSAYIYGFTRYVIWPDDHNQGDFEIVVLGESPITEQLYDLASKKKVGDRNIKITKITNPSEIKKCNILYLPANQSAHFNTVMTKVISQPTLLITEEVGLGMKGSDINFIMKDGKLVFELNQAAASKHNLKISNALMALAILI
jgi:hypothetical protein